MPTPSEILSLPSGAQWVKADLHVHTPASADIDDEWKNATPEDVVRIAIDNGLDAIAITDHNTALLCDSVREAANETDLVVFPGVEISTTQGHLLAIFDTDVPAVRIEDMLISVGLSRADFGNLHAATPQGIAEVAAKITEFGGIAIAAHADAKRGFLQMIDVGTERERVYSSHDLWAMELLDTSTREQHQTGSRYPRRMTCIQSSDCWPKGADHHQLDGIGYRHTFFKMDERSLDGLKLALIDPEIRVRLMEDDFPTPENVILGMWVSGGFLDGQAIRFSENVSCFIGDTGSGKSVATELLRFGLDQRAVVQKIRQEVDSLLQHQLGDPGTVHILLSKNGSQYLVERTWSPIAQPPLVQRVTGDALQPVEGLDMRVFFPVKCFSQSEIIEFAREPGVRLSLTDDLIDCSAEFADIENIKANLRENAAAIMAEQQKRDNIMADLSARAALVEDVERIDSVLNDDRIVLQQLWYSEQSILNQARTELQQVSDNIANLTSPLDWSITLPDDADTLPNQDVLRELKNTHRSWQIYVQGLNTGIQAKFDGLRKDIEVLRSKWDSRFERAEESYRQLLQELDEGGIGLQALSVRRQSTQEQIDGLNRKEEQLQQHIIPEIDALNQRREHLLDQLQTNRRSITAKREQKARQLSRALDHQVRLHVRGRANNQDFRNGLQSIATGAYLQSSDLNALSVNCHPVSFVKKLISHDFNDIAEQSGLDSPKIDRLWDTVIDRQRLAELYDLQLIDVEDIIDVQLKVDQSQYRNLEELSHGQKCMVVLMISLAEGDFPLVVDQPEDALHAPSIEEGIVSSLRSDRGNRQCLFATRNANILVSADAEQIIALKADAQHGEVHGTGSLDRFDHRRLIIYHVEGGEGAFQRRKMMYTLEPSA